MKRFRFLDTKEYLVFDDLNFEHRLGRGGFNYNIQAKITFPNGWGVSVIRGPHTYGGDQGLYELSVTYDNEIHYDNPVAEGDVLGYLTREMVTEKMLEIQNFVGIF